MEKDTSGGLLHLICIGVDPSLISSLLTKPEAANLSLDICKNLQDAKEKISSTIYDAFIINLDQHESAVLPLLQQIRQKNPQATIALILDGPAQNNQLKQLKEEQKIDCLMEKSKFQQEIETLLRSLQEKKEGRKPPYKSKMPELKRKFDEAMREKLPQLKELVSSSKDNPERIKEFKAEIHKIAGTAGSFGYGGATSLCKKMEIEINERIASGTYKDANWIAGLDPFLEKLKQELQASSVEAPAEAKTRTPAAKPLLYAVDDDINFLELLERIKNSFSVDLAVESDPKKAYSRLQDQNFNPSGIIAAEKFRSSSIKGFDILEAQTKKGPSSPIFALLLEKDTIEMRVEAMEKGANYIFIKPVSAHILLKTMSEALNVNPLNPLKVLILDDDPNFCDYAIEVLSEVGITATAIYDPVNLFTQLEEIKPDILLLDLMLPKYDGFNLLKTLRQDVSYKNLTIVIVTGSEQLDTRINAYAANVEDILFKPIDSNVLQKRILNIADRKTPGESRDNYTGLPQLKELMDALSQSLKKTSRPDSYLVLFEVHNFDEWSKRRGIAAVRDLMISISNRLQWEIDHRVKCFWYKSSIFALILEGIELENLEKKIYGFLNRVVQENDQPDLSFNCSITAITKDFENSTQVLQAAEENLLSAALKDPSSTKIVHTPPKEIKDLKKEVAIIDPNCGLLKILKQAFESHGLKVKTYSEGGEALKELLNSKESSLPSLMIVERQLPDMDGMDLFLKLKSRFKDPIPFFMLTVFSADKDISEGIRQGVVEYIVKPFNISILVQRALQEIYKE